MFFLTGVARYLFVPLAEAVVFAMLASYFLSRTLVPTMAKYLLRGARAGRARHDRRRTVLRRGSSAASRSGSSGSATRYRRLLAARPAHAARCSSSLFLAFCVVSVAVLLPVARPGLLPVGRQRPDQAAPARADRNAHRGDRAALRPGRRHRSASTIPPDELETIIDNIGVPYSGINLSYSNSAPIGPADADILVSLEGEPSPDRSRYIQRAARAADAASFPGVTFYFLPADIVSQILNFGLPAPIDVQVVGQRPGGNRAFADKLLQKMRAGAGHRRPAHPAAVRPARAPRRRRPHAGRSRSATRSATSRGNLLVALSAGAPRPRRRSGSTRRTASATRSRRRRRSTGSSSLAGPRRTFRSPGRPAGRRRSSATSRRSRAARSSARSRTTTCSR